MNPNRSVAFDAWRPSTEDQTDLRAASSGARVPSSRLVCMTGGLVPDIPCSRATRGAATKQSDEFRVC